MERRFTTLARNLRTASTDAERRFWSRVRARRLDGWKFKRQHELGRYIVDFVCLEATLIVELDGGQHVERASDDRERDAWLAGRGFKVLRFWNNDVLANTDGVMTEVLQQLSKQSFPRK